MMMMWHGRCADADNWQERGQTWWMMHLWSTMLILLRCCKPRLPYIDALSRTSSTATTTRHALSSSLVIRRSHRFHSTSSTSDGSLHRVDDGVPFFPIYYNDIYEVDLPPGHRFPMWKYRKVRELVQAKVGGSGGLTDEDYDARSRVYCGKLTTNSS